MSHQRYPSIDAVKEPHSVSLKVLRLSRPSLVAQYPLQPPFSSPSDALSHPPPIPASLAYGPYGPSNAIPPTNPAPFVLSPVLNLPPSFGSAYVGETFSCTLCANHDIPEDAAGVGAGPKKSIRDVRIEAEMKTPSSSGGGGGAIKLPLFPPSGSEAGGGLHHDTSTASAAQGGGGGIGGVDLPSAGTSLQKILSFDLKEEGNHVLAVTVSYYEASELSGRTRTFRKLYQFACKSSLIVRTKVSALPAAPAAPTAAGGRGERGERVRSEEKEEEEEEKEKEEKEEKEEEKEKEEKKHGQRRRWVLEAQLENCSEEGILLESVGLELEKGLGYEDCNDWEGGPGNSAGGLAEGRRRPLLQPGETEQVCFVVEEEGVAAAQEVEGRVVFGVLQIGWRSEMGNRGFLSTGKLGTRYVKLKGRS